MLCCVMLCCAVSCCRLLCKDVVMCSVWLCCIKQICDMSCRGQHNVCLLPDSYSYVPAEMIMINGRGIVQYNFEATVDEELTVDRGEQVIIISFTLQS